MRVEHEMNGFYPKEPAYKEMKWVRIIILPAASSLLDRWSRSTRKSYPSTKQYVRSSKHVRVREGLSFEEITWCMDENGLGWVLYCSHFSKDFGWNVASNCERVFRNKFTLSSTLSVPLAKLQCSTPP
jgi:hypothetical protein